MSYVNLTNKILKNIFNVPNGKHSRKNAVLTCTVTYKLKLSYIALGYS